MHAIAQMVKNIYLGWVLFNYHGYVDLTDWRLVESHGFIYVTKLLTFKVSKF